MVRQNKENHIPNYSYDFHLYIISNLFKTNIMATLLISDDQNEIRLDEELFVSSSFNSLSGSPCDQCDLSNSEICSLAPCMPSDRVDKMNRIFKKKVI